MKALLDKIQSSATIISDDMIDVTSFINGNVDAALMHDLGKDFAQHYRNYDFSAFITVESSGIAPSVFAAYYAEKPLVVIKKSTQRLPAPYIQQACYSFTKQSHYYLSVKETFINDRSFILIDDFLAQGSVVKNVELLLEQKNSSLSAIGICIAKCFQPGYQALKSMGYDLYCQAKIAEMDPDTQNVLFLE